MSPRKRVGALLACAAAAVIAYSPGLAGPFIFDDVDAIERNPSITTLSPLSVPLHPPEKTALTGRPVANLSLAATYAVNEALGIDQGEAGNPRQTVAFHLGNLLLHLACAGLLFGVLRRTFQDGHVPEDWRAIGNGISAAITALWLIHPLQSEVVLYATQRTEVLASAFYLLTLYAAIRAWDARGPRALGWSVVSVIACALGVGTKEMVATAPLVVVLYDRAFRTESWREAFRRRAWLYAAIVGAVAAILSRMPTDARNRTVGFTLGITWYQYFYTQCWAITRYLSLTLFPDRLALDYGISPIRGLRGVPGLVMLTIAGIATVLAWTKNRRWVWAGFLGAWFFVILAPSSSFVPIVTEVAAERRMHLALAAPITAAVISIVAMRRRLRAMSAGGDSPFRSRGMIAILAVTALVFALASRWTASRAGGSWAEVPIALLIGTAASALLWFALRRDPVRVLAGVVCALAVGTFFRARTFADEERVWRDSMAKIAWNPRAPSNLGAIVEERSATRRPEAVALYREAIARDSLFSPAWYNLAELSMDEGRAEDARRLLEKAVATNPNAANAYSLLGRLALQRGDAAKAVEYLERVAGAPPSEQTLIDLSDAYWRTGREMEATGALVRELQLFPGRNDVAVSLGKILLLRGEPSQAAGILSRAAEERPNDPDALTAFAMALRQLGRRDEAIALLRHALKLAPDFAPAREELKRIGG